MQTIYKYAVTMSDTFTLAMPANAQVLSVQVQHGHPQLWALVDPDAPKQPRTFRVVGTGHPMEDAGRCRFIGTFQVENGYLVFHLFEVEAPSSVIVEA